MAGKRKDPAGGLDFVQVRDGLAREEAGVTFRVTDRDGHPIPYGDGHVTITVRGAQAPTFRRLADEFARNFYAKRLGGVTDLAERQRIVETAAAERETAFDEEVRAPNILAWEGILDGGEPVEVTPERALEAIRTPYLRNQIVQAQEMPERFFDEASEP